MNKVGTSRITDIVRTVFSTELPFSHRRDDLDVEPGERIVRITYSSFELSGADGDLSSIKFHLRLDDGELWIGDLNVAKPFRRQGVGRRLVQAAEIVASETGMEVVNLFPLHSSGPFWAKLGYVPIESRPRSYRSRVDVAALSLLLKIASFANISAHWHH